MPDKPQTAPNPFFALSDHHLVALTGRDATVFAQAQFMNDVAALTPGHWQWNGWLTPKGRLIAVFALLKLDAETLWLLLPDTAPADFAQQLQRFVFRSKVTIAVRKEFRIGGTFAASTLASGNHFTGDADRVIELDLSADGGGRALRIGAALEIREDDDALARWRVFDLSHGLPRLDTAQTGQWTPQQLSLDRLRAYSVKKGCYPGQEIVARTHFLGQAKRGLALLEADAVPTFGDEVRDGEGHAIGALVSTSGTRALAVLPRERAWVSLFAGDVAVRETPLLDGLAR